MAKRQTFTSDFFHDILSNDLLFFLIEITRNSRRALKFSPNMLISRFLAYYELKYHSKDINAESLFNLLKALDVCPQRDFRRKVKRYKIVKRKVVLKCPGGTN